MVRFPTVCADRSMIVTLQDTRAVALKMIMNVSLYFTSPRVRPSYIMPFAFLMIAKRQNKNGVTAYQIWLRFTGNKRQRNEVNCKKCVASVCALRMRLINRLQETAESARACRTLAKSSPVAQLCNGFISWDGLAVDRWPGAGGWRWSAGGDAVSERSGARSTTQLLDNLVKLLHNANGTLSYYRGIVRLTSDANGRVR